VPWHEDPETPHPEHLYRKEFASSNLGTRARLYITAQGVYEAEINGKRVGDQFLAPGWTAYDGRLQYQAYDVTHLLADTGLNCIGVRLAEGWFSGHLAPGLFGFPRNIWGAQDTLMAQLEIHYANGSEDTIVTDATWQTAPGPTRLAEIYRGEKYDTALEVDGWSSVGRAGSQSEICPG
jgi:alpha-L-rhamnosidase